jgi:hypothetical protein
MFSLSSVFAVVTDGVGIRRDGDSHAVTQVGAMNADAISLLFTPQSFITADPTIFHEIHLISISSLSSNK